MLDLIFSTQKKFQYFPGSVGTERTVRTVVPVLLRVTHFAKRASATNWLGQLDYHYIVSKSISITVNVLADSLRSLTAIQPFTIF